MVDINQVSGRTRQIVDDIAERDGKKGITSKAERDALAEALSGQITGNVNQKYVQGLIDEYDKQSLKENASKDVVKDINKRIMGLEGDNDVLNAGGAEEGAIDAIIDNTYGHYSEEDIAYARSVKGQFGLSTKTPTEERVDALKSQQNELEEIVTGLNETIENLEGEITRLTNELNTATENKDELQAQLTKTEGALKKAQAERNQARQEAQRLRRTVDDLKKTKEDPIPEPHVKEDNADAPVPSSPLTRMKRTWQYQKRIGDIQAQIDEANRNLDGAIAGGKTTLIEIYREKVGRLKARLAEVQAEYNDFLSKNPPAES